MTILKIIAKILLLPVAAALTLVQWIGIFLSGILGMVTLILSCFIVIVEIISLAMRIVTVQTFIQMLAFAFVIFIIPHIVNWVLIKIHMLRYVIGDFIRS